MYIVITEDGNIDFQNIKWWDTVLMILLYIFVIPVIFLFKVCSLNS